MCGIIGLVGKGHINNFIFDGLSLLQHRGQDAAGIATLHKGKFYLHKDVGMISDVFNTQRLSELVGNIGIGHVRYPTAGNPGASESQPFYVNSPQGIMFAHNGNLTNVEELTKILHDIEKRHLNTSSDSELLLNVFACGLSQHNKKDFAKNKDIESISIESVFSSIEFLNKNARGGFACVAVIAGLGLVAFRDKNGIRPLVLGKREDENGIEYMVASESVALDITGFKLVRNIKPGEAIVITPEAKLHSKICADNSILSPCLFEYVYFARPDSVLDEASVYQVRIDAGKFLGDKILREWGNDIKNSLDVVIPIPETGRVAAQEIANIIGVEYREGFVKNRYIGRTFIMPLAKERTNSVRRKLNPIPMEFNNKNVLLVDDSIVRGTTSQNIVKLVRELGAKKVFLASASPPVKYPNVYGIDMPTKSELLAGNKNIEEITKEIGVDNLIFLDLEDLKKAVQLSNPLITQFEDSVFSGDYITGCVTEEYLAKLEKEKNKAKSEESKKLAFLADNLTSNL